MRLKHRHLHQSDRCRCWLGVLERRVAALIPVKAEPIKRRLPLTSAKAHRRAWEDRLQSHLGPRRKLRVGIVWSGNPKHPNDHKRSVPLRMLLDVRDARGDFVSLQKGPGPDDMILLRQAGILDLISALTDFAETAELVSCLDLGEGREMFPRSRKPARAIDSVPSRGARAL
jgi:hypothetical protein